MNIIDGVWISFHDLGFLITKRRPSHPQNGRVGVLFATVGQWAVHTVIYCNFYVYYFHETKYLDTRKYSSRMSTAPCADRVRFNSHHQMSLSNDHQMLLVGVPDLMSEWRGGGSPGAMSRGLKIPPLERHLVVAIEAHTIGAGGGTHPTGILSCDLSLTNGITVSGHMVIPLVNRQTNITFAQLRWRVVKLCRAPISHRSLAVGQLYLFTGQKLHKGDKCEIYKGKSILLSYFVYFSFCIYRLFETMTFW